MRTLLAPLALTLLLGASAQAAEEDSSARAARGNAVWAAFDCSVLAEHLKNTPEQTRLFNYGLAQGRQFIKDMQAKRINPTDIDSTVPMGVLNSLSGPSPDFMLGRIYASASESTLRDVFSLGGQWLDAAAQRTRAASKFASQNCNLVGR
ncbi:Uncharacterised protein [Achromobacter sp. 2789STDY5608633]|uniref:hypothetical protein n=1 Tax=Achromobacter sp. 2789STDY5608633 TaxID=1806501 RepID=UPI0006C1BD8D|nr:hypothetical protein [Achromobacter sp. 2789STDY5608633]CUJ46620.1 Uncharacterised protein [Achromobacter sp. 2789STDY5608633]